MATTVASLQAVLSLDKSDFDRGIKTSTGLLEKIGTGAVGIGLNALTGALTGVGQAAIGMAEDSLKASTDLEHQMSGIAAVMGLAKDEVLPLREVVDQLALSPDLTVSTFEAADAIEMLGKNGLKVTDIMQGAAEATVQLSNATGGDFAQSADVMTDVLQLWNKEFRDGKGNIRDMTRAVDRITAATVNSKFDMNDFALALAQGGGVAAASGVEFDDFAAVVAGISSSFASGSDAGTSFKTMLQRLAAPTDAARDLMAEMGFSAYDAAGNLKPMIDIVDGLNDTFKRMDEETKAATLTELFGSDAMRAASALASITREEFAQLQAQMADVSAAEQAATRMDNLAGSFDVFQGVVESLKVQLGDELNPVLKDLLDESIIPLATKHGPAMVEAFSGAVSGVGDFIAEAQAAGSPVMELGQALQTGLIEPGAELAKALTGLNGELSTTDTVMQSIKVVSDEMSPALNTFGSVLGILTGIVDISNTAFEKMDKSLESVGLKVDSGKVAIQGMLDAALGLLIPVTSLVNAFETLNDSVTLLTGNWDGFKRVLEDEIGLPAWLVPGSPTPFETGLRGISSAINSMPDLAQALPGGGNAGNAGNTYNLNMGGQQFSFTGQNGKEEALAAMLQMLRAQLNAA